MGERHKRNPNINCIICSKAIYKRPFEIQRNKGRVFCSTICYGVSCRKEKPCIVCEKPILARFNKKCCSRSCANKHRSGIKYKLSLPRKDKVAHLKVLKLRLLEVRGKNCERCNYDKPEILQIHHKDRSRENNDLANLELICPNCHFEEHFLEKSWLKKLSAIRRDAGAVEQEGLENL